MATMSTGPFPATALHQLVLVALRTPVVHGMLDHGLCQLRYDGRRSGRPVALPVQYARDGADIVVHVGHSAGKTWWRNFRTPQPVDVMTGGSWYHGVGRAVTSTGPGRERVREVYRGQHPRVRTADGDPFVLITCGPKGGRNAQVRLQLRRR